jgi:DNA-binding NtrC family response regulator
MKPDLPRVLVVEPGAHPPRWISALRGDGFAVSWVGDGPSALERIAEAPVDAVVTRLRGKRVDGRALLSRLRGGSTPTCVIVLAGAIGPDQVAGLIDEGAEDVHEGPVRVAVLRAALRRGLAHAARARRLAVLEQAMDRRYRDDPLTGASAAVRRVVDQVHHVAPTRAMVLIEGEPGTGKARVARAIHRDSPRRDGPFERVSLAALEESRTEAELFGGVGAAAGRFDVADGGTLFLEDVDRASAAVQIRLLSAIRGRGAGPKPERRRDVRLLASTEHDLAARVRAGRFRQDLFERLGAVRIALPPLRERREDIPLLVERFLREFNRAHSRRVGGITRGALEALAAHAWPGNVDELRNQVEAMVVAAHGRRRLDLSDLPPALRRDAPSSGHRLVAGMTVEEAERHLIESTLRHAQGNKPRAAAMLGIGLRTLYRKILKYRLE